MKTAILHVGHAPESLIPIHGDYDLMSKTLLGLAPHEADSFVVLDGEFPSSIDAYDLYLITGSPCGVYEGLPWISKLEDFIRATFQSQAKIIGLCFGHQIMAQAMGGTVEKSNKGYGIGVMDYHLAHPSMPGQDISLCAWHQDQVIKQPLNSTLILTSEFCPIAGLAYGEQAISFQPHPEFTRAFVKDMISVRRSDTITEGMADEASESLSKITDTPLIQKVIQSML